MYDNVTVSRVKGDGPLYSVRSRSEDGPENDQCVRGNVVHVGGIEVRPSTTMVLGGGPFEVEKDGKEIYIEE